MFETVSVFITISNTDEKLTHSQWVDFWDTVQETFESYQFGEHGSWVTPSNELVQNACWSFDVYADRLDDLRDELRTIADRFKQNSIAFSIAKTEFVTPR